MNKMEFIEKAICKKTWRKYVDKKDEPAQGLDFEDYKNRLINYLIKEKNLTDIYFLNYTPEMQHELNNFTERYLLAEFM